MQFLRASERDEQGGACCLSVFRSGMVPDGGCSPEGVGRVCRSDQGGIQPGGRGKEGVQRSLSREGALYSALSSSAGEGPPLVQHRPRVTYSGTAKGPLLGGLPIVSGLEGVCDVEEKETGLNPAACCENAWSGVKAIEKSEAWG